MDTRMCLCLYGEMYVVDLAKVMYFQADDHYTHVYYSSGTHFMVPFGLAKVEAAVSGFLGCGSFLVRLGRGHIINIHRVFHVNTMRQELRLSDDQGSTLVLHLPKLVLRKLMSMLSDRNEPPVPAKRHINNN